MLEICKASAGSGKTHKLTGEYLKMLFSGGTDRYKSILAVTFTNKATGEMKQRVLEELHRLASGGKSPFAEELAAIGRFAEMGAAGSPPDAVDEAVRRHASALLSAILNDYSLFNISTIDRFFQQVLRAFAIETGHFSSYSVEINDSSILALAVDELMNSIDDNEELLQWLIDLSIEAVENGRDWNSVPQLIRLGTELFREPFKLAVRGAGVELAGRATIAECGKVMRRIVREFREESRKMADQAADIMKRYGLSPSDFKGGSRSFMNYFDRLRSGRYESPSATFVAMAEEEPSGWCSSSARSRKQDIISAWHAGLGELVRRAADQERLAAYFTAQEILRNLSVAGILSDIETQVRDHCRRNNLVLLSDTPRFLSDIIGGSDTPFIYERVGSRLDNYLLDEFQDTSRMQWGNFEPLLRDSVDAGHPCLIVGDVKQSIYRWRGSDWRLLDTEVASGFDPRKVISGTLAFNWRSSEDVVGFNNSFFGAAGTLTGDGFIGRIYSDAVQKLPQGSRRPEGHVRVVFTEGRNADMAEESYQQRILEAVRTLLEHGYMPGDIAFLVRTRVEGASISDLLIANGYSIMTEDSLRISSSPAVRRVVDRLRELAAGREAVKEKSLYNICESMLRDNPARKEEGGAAFVNAFLDCVLEYIGTEGSDISGFLNWWDSEGAGRPVSAPEGRDALRVITIHKSKGLEFKAVIIPYLQIPFVPRGNSSKYIWCSSSVPPFDMLPVYPLECRSSLEQTVFAGEYRREMQLEAVDAVNVAYVAFTRAVQELLVFALVRPQQKDGPLPPSSVSNILYNHLSPRLMDNVYESGEWTVPFRKSGEGGTAGAEMADVPSVPLGDRLRLSLSGEEFFSKDSLRMRGIVLHGILSKVETASDLEGAVRDAVLSGILPGKDGPQVLGRLSTMLRDVAGRHWFDGTYRLMNETPILSPGGESYRPDRMMFSRDGRKAVVVDYKFGRRRDGEYRSQVRGYMELLKQMGYEDVEGWLWYGEDGVEGIV